MLSVVWLQFFLARGVPKNAVSLTLLLY